MFTKLELSSCSSCICLFNIKQVPFVVLTAVFSCMNCIITFLRKNVTFLTFTKTKSACLSDSIILRFYSGLFSLFPLVSMFSNTENFFYVLVCFDNIFSLGQSIKTMFDQTERLSLKSYAT